MLLTHGELFVCKIMAVLGVSQPLVSRNLAMLRDAGVVEERKEKKLVYYSLKKSLRPRVRDIIKILKAELKDDRVFLDDLATLRECNEFQRRAGGACDMKTYLDFMERKRKKKKAAA
jgi:DNA-binding transcriptional ArsR family regulator